MQLFAYKFVRGWKRDQWKCEIMRRKIERKQNDRGDFLKNMWEKTVHSTFSLIPKKHCLPSVFKIIFHFGRKPRTSPVSLMCGSLQLKHKKIIYSDWSPTKTHTHLVSESKYPPNLYSVDTSLPWISHIFVRKFEPFDRPSSMKTVFLAFAFFTFILYFLAWVFTRLFRLEYGKTR